MALLYFLIRRILLAGLVLLGVSFGSFVFLAGKFETICGPKTHTLSATLPWYWRWLQGVPSRYSLTTSACGWPPLWTNLRPALERTSALLAFAMVLVLVFGLALGIVAAHTAGSALDVVLRAFSYLAWAVPAFLLALCVQWLFTWLGAAHGLHPFKLLGWPGFCPDPAHNPFDNDPTGNPPPTFDCPAAPHGLGYDVACLRYLTLPAVSLAVGFVGVHSRQLRSSLLVTLGAPYATTARAKGLSERRVLLRHALRVSLGTFVSAFLLDFGAIFGGALAVDWVFRMGGIGMLFINEVTASYVDPYAVQLLLLVAATFVVTSSLLAELGVIWLDPRTRPT